MKRIIYYWKTTKLMLLTKKLNTYIIHLEILNFDVLVLISNYIDKNFNYVLFLIVF
jgi:hypothetical protein